MTIIRQVLHVYKGFMCEHLTVQKRDERYKGLATTFSFLQTGPPRLTLGGEKKHQSNQSNLKMKKFDESNLT